MRFVGLGRALIILGGLAAAGFFLMRNSFTGVGFLMRFLSVLGVLIAVFGLFLLPTGSPSLSAALHVGKAIFVGCFILCFAAFIIFETQIIKASYGTPNPSADAVIVLGAGLYGVRPSAALVSRLDAALGYLNQNPHAVAVLSGGQGAGEDISEASAMRSYLMERGIAAERLFEEDKSTSTEENLRLSKAILEKSAPQVGNRAIIVSNDFHLYRAHKMAESLGFSPQTIAAETPHIGLLRVNCYLREFFAVATMHVMSLF